MASCGVASQVDQLPPPPPHSAAIVSDAGEPTSASQVDPEAQLQPPPPPPTDDPPASFLEKVVPLVIQLSLSAGLVTLGGPTARNHELAFKLYNLAVFAIYCFDITLGIYLSACFFGIDRPWVRKAAIPLISGVLALSVATAVLGTVIDLLP